MKNLHVQLNNAITFYAMSRWVAFRYKCHMGEMIYFTKHLNIETYAS